jgi:hypothetical protein
MWQLSLFYFLHFSEDTALAFGVVTVCNLISNVESILELVLNFALFLSNLANNSNFVLFSF